MSYVTSDKITVFPLSKNRATDSNSRALYEDRIANIIRQIVDVEGFVISNLAQDDRGVLTEDFEFNLHGYFIKLHSGTSLNDLSTGEKLWASLQIKNYEINGQDTGTSPEDRYEGVQFTSEKPAAPTETGVTQYSIQLLTKVDGTWTINSDSMFKMNASNIDFEDISFIDGKHS